MRVSDGSAVVGDNVGDLVFSHFLALDCAKLEGCLLSIDLVSLVSSLNVVEDSEVLSSFLNANNVHNAEGEAGISSDFVVNLNQSFLISYDLHGLLTGERVSQSISEEDGKRNAFSSLVGSSRWSGCENSTELVQHPVGWSCYSLLMFFGSSCLYHN